MVLPLSNSLKAKASTDLTQEANIGADSKTLLRSAFFRVSGSGNIIAPSLNSALATSKALCSSFGQTAAASQKVHQSPSLNLGFLA